jgi:PrcB C-terminal
VGAIAGYAATKGGGAGKPVAWRNIAPRVGEVHWARPTISVARDQQKLDKLFEVATYGSHPAAPRLDFTRNEAVLVTVGPRSSSGYSLHVVRAAADGSLNILVRERTPSLGDKVVPRVTYPYLLLVLPKSGKHVSVRYAGRS